jgi:predicted DCC family thiol-disulfide oxidoreductase YuxK
MDTTAWVRDVEERIEQRAAPTGARSPRALVILFDPSCSLCRRVRDWMLRQESYVELRFLACTGPEARARFGDLPWLGDELIVVADNGDVWVGPAAFLTCLWALVEWREWSFRLSGPAFAPLAERFFHALSSRRKGIAALLDHDCTDGACHIRR